MRTEVTIDRAALSRSEVMAKLAVSREELRRVLDPPRDQVDGDGEPRADGFGGFPRSRTMQLLMSGRGLGTLGALAGGLLMARPTLALRLLKFVPASAVAKILFNRAVTALKERPRKGG
jgi:hypothetical protein